jgi:predicted transcriptional regulator
MLRLRDIMTREVLVLSPQATLREAVDALAQQHVSGAPVLEGDTVVGVITASDILDFQAGMAPQPRDRDEDPDFDELEPEPPSELENDPPGTYFTELWAGAGAEVAERFASTETREWDVLAEHTVAEAMSRGVRSLRPEASVQAAAALMINAGIHRVLVMEGDRLCGIVSTMDVTRAVADQRLEPRRFVFGRPSRGRTRP